jgi:hypothetical protein
MYLVVTPAQLHKAIGSSKDDVAYVVGYLLRRLETFKSDCAEDPAIMLEFVRHNSQSQELAMEMGIPTTTIVHREKHEGCLHRPGKQWFDFACISEALYVVNFTPENMLQHQGTLLMEIEYATRESHQLRLAFSDCFPLSFGTGQKKRAWRVFYLVLLSCFKMLKGRDFLRKVKQHVRMKEGAKGMDTCMGIRRWRQSLRVRHYGCKV